MLSEMIVEVTAVHEIKNETEFISCLEGIVEIDDEGTVVDLCKHVLFVESESFSFLKFNALLVQEFHGKPRSRVERERNEKKIDTCR